MATTSSDSPGAPRSHSLRFSRADLDGFGRASLDVNPLHLSDAYARRTPFGERVVYGVLGALAALGRGRERPQQSLARISCDFFHPMFCDIDYRLELDERDELIARIYDGRRLLLSLVATFRPGATTAPDDGGGLATRDRPMDRANEALVPGLCARGSYLPRWPEVRALTERLGLVARGVGAVEAAVLMGASFIVGMELPGQRALFSKLAIDRFPDLDLAGNPLAYEVEVRAFDKRFDLLAMDARLVAGATAVPLKLAAFVRRDITPATPHKLDPSHELRGRVAFITGASRGLGAAIARRLAYAGCTVIANFFQCREEAEQLARDAGTGKIILMQGDASDLAWSRAAREQIIREHGRLDYLVCNAAPRLLPSWIEPDAVERLNEYVRQSLALVSVPMATLLPLVAESGGVAVVISSAAVRNSPADWPHYVGAKYAIEGLTHVAATEYKSARFLIVRPPKLLTDLVNTPMGRVGATAPTSIAEQIFARLNAGVAPGRIAILDEAGGSDVDPSQERSV
jgi:NAD(P)-dependent dehydrogenase (short-subunit alcohol dehydrogenase family)